MDIQTIGKIIKNIRENVLKINQNKLAKYTNSSQALISRLENGEGGSITLLFSILNYYKAKNINVHYIFLEPFLPELMQTGQVQKKQISEFIEYIIDNSTGDLQRLKLLVSTMEN